MRVLVTGSNGQLGYDVIKRLDCEGVEYLGTNLESLDITNQEQVFKIIENYNPDVVIHCAAYTSVDKAESEKELCYSVNVLGTKSVVEACKKADAKMVYISTDYVFDGEGDKPFEVTDQPNPINYYGFTKYEGELEVQKSINKYFIVRISWVFGNNGNNFVKKILKLGKERDEIFIVSDQIGSPTYTFDFAKLLSEMVKTDMYGIYHATNDGFCSWYEFASEIINQAGIEVKVKPINSNDFSTIAKRPKNSKLRVNYEKFIDKKIMPHWKTSLKHYLSR